MKGVSDFHISVFPGDGIGPEVIAPCLKLLRKVTHMVGGFELSFVEASAGAACYEQTGSALPRDSMDEARRADAILLAAMGLPSIRYDDGTEIAPQLDLRFELGLYAGVRPVRAIQGIPRTLADPKADNMDFVIVRESTEGLFVSRDKGVVIDDRLARDTLEITRDVSERLFDFSFRLAARRKVNGAPGRVTCVDKANVFRSFAFFRQIFDERAALYVDIEATHAYVDATALDMVRRPWQFDVLVTENMFGDILSDLGAGLVGGMGMAPSADIGDEHAVFQPCHGSAPDIVGTGRANPTAMFLSSAMMLEWLGEKHDVRACTKAARLIRTTVDHAFKSGLLRSFELGGNSGTVDITRAVYDALAIVDLDQFDEGI